MNRSLTALIPALFPVLALAQYPGSTPPPDDLKRGFDAITQKKAKDIDGFLAGPICQGRGTGQPGFQKAADFVAAHFKAAGLKPMGDNGTYFQFSTFYRTSADGTKMETDQGHVLPGTGAVLNTPRQDVDVTAPVIVVCAHDATAKLSDDDAKKLDGKIVVEVVPAGRSALRSQVAVADTKGVLIVQATNPAVSPAVSRNKNGGGSSIVSGRINQNLLDRIDPAINQGLLKTGSASAFVVETGRTLHISAKSKTEAVQVPNVVGLLEGSDPVLKNEYIGVGGHLDHLGINNGVVYPGADDDGSGSTAVMLICDAMGHNPHRPKRSILFMTFFGEEMGLLGSSYITDHPVVPLDKMVSELQMDMIARDSYGAQNGDPSRVDKLEENMDTMRLVGSKRISTELDQIIQEQNEHIKFRFKYDSEDVYTRSDHYNFAKHGIPIAFLFDGFTPDYHQPSDTVDKIDFVKLVSAARLYYLTAYAIADRDQAPKHDVAGQ